MWCTVCHARFDWTSGRFYASNAFHNPHLIEYLHANRIAAEQVGERRVDMGEGRLRCGERFGDMNMVRILEILGDLTQDRRRAFLRVIEQLKNVRHTVLPKLEPPFLRDPVVGGREDPNLDLRLNYLVGDMDADKVSNELFQRERAIMIMNEYRGILGLYDDVCEDILRTSLSDVTYDPIRQHNGLVVEINKTLVELNDKFKRKVVAVINSL